MLGGNFLKMANCSCKRGSPLQNNPASFSSQARQGCSGPNGNGAPDSLQHRQVAQIIANRPALRYAAALHLYETLDPPPPAPGGEPKTMGPQSCRPGGSRISRTPPKRKRA